MDSVFDNLFLQTEQLFFIHSGCGGTGDYFLSQLQLIDLNLHVCIFYINTKISVLTLFYNCIMRFSQLFLSLLIHLRIRGFVVIIRNRIARCNVQS